MKRHSCRTVSAFVSRASLQSTGGADGGNPYSGVIRDSAGNFYGTTAAGGPANVGVVYKLDTAGHETVLYSFTGGADGWGPEAGVIRDSAGNLYGTTLFGGGANAGVVFKVDTAGQETVLYSFTGGAVLSTLTAGVDSEKEGQHTCNHSDGTYVAR
jgi:uncharacterized repeat protein (TIGR03803 family)